MHTRLSSAAVRTTVLLDLESLEYFDPAVRRALTDVLRTYRRRATPICLLASAPWARLGASVAALALALEDVRVTDDRAMFEHELALAVGRGRRRTNAWELVDGWQLAA
jgi:hypothetical protein